MNPLNIEHGEALAAAIQKAVGTPDFICIWRDSDDHPRLISSLPAEHCHWMLTEIAKGLQAVITKQEEEDPPEAEPPE